MSIINTLNKDTHYFTLDLHEGATLAEPLHFKQHDHNSRILAIELTVHNVSLDLTDARVDIWVYKADGHLVQKAVDKANTDLENSTVMIPLTAQMLSVLPEIECEIVVTYANKSVLSFPAFKIQIEDSNVDVNTVVSTSEFNLFYDALYRMEQWMRDYLTKYDTIDRAFQTKLQAIEEEKVRIINDFEELSADLIQQDEIRFEELKQLTIGEFAEWFTKAKADFAYAGREIEKRYNELWEKCSGINDQMQEIIKESEEHKKVIENLRKLVEELNTDMQSKYNEFVAIYEDGVKKLQEMENTFQADQAQRATAFANAQSEREANFNNAQSQRDKDFQNAQSTRTNAYNTAEANRNKIFAEAEALRQSNEEKREQGFSEMQEQFNISMTYRVIE